VRRRRAPTSAWSTRRRDALRIAQETPAREVVFFAIGFETTTPPTAVVLREAERAAWATSRCSATTCSRRGDRRHPRPGTGGRERHSPDRRVSSVRRTCLCVIGSRPVRVFCAGVPATHRDRRVRAAGRDAGGAHAGAPVERGATRGRKRIHARGHPRGKRQGAGAGRRGVRAAQLVRMARLGRGARQRIEDQAAFRAFRCGAALRHRLPSGPRQQGLRVRFDSARREEAGRVPGVRQRLHAGEPLGFLHGVQRRRCAAAYTYGRFRRPAGSMERASA